MKNCFLSLFAMLGSLVQAQQTANSTQNDSIVVPTISLTEVSLEAEQRENPLSVIPLIDLRVRPVVNSQEILRYVPGLFIGQHAGGGKAEQLFIRGFDIDHGTDVALSVDGMPVNMVSHAHGQGYADLHFVIPETIERIEFSKGPHQVSAGNFATAAAVEIRTKSVLSKGMFKLEGGPFNTQRGVAMLPLFTKNSKHSAYVASEFYRTDGPFKASQDFKRFNGLFKHRFEHRGVQLQSQLSHFSSDWLASGQIPLRALPEIGWFGAIDPTEGGDTQRTNLSSVIQWKANETDHWQHQFYAINNQFTLYSNFTFFAADPINGDQIAQKEQRNTFGFKGSFKRNHSAAAPESKRWNRQSQVGWEFRQDHLGDLSLSRTLNRSRLLSSLSNGTGVETQSSLYVKEAFQQGSFLFSLALRADAFHFKYSDFLADATTQLKANSLVLSPKFNLQYEKGQAQYFLKVGRGFHSNDMRVAVRETPFKTIPGAWGSDLGSLFRIGDDLIISASLWALYLEQEFIYVGDEAVVEPSGQTFRSGIEFSGRYQWRQDWFLSLDVNATRARAYQEPKGSQYLPLAPLFTTTASLQRRWKSGTMALNYRHLADRPANEDNSIKAVGYHMLDGNISWSLSPRLTLSGVFENLLNVKWKETQFLTESRLASESEAIEEIHFTPGTPRNMRIGLTYEF